MKNLLLIPTFLLFGAILFTTNTETIIIEEVACTYQTSDGSYSVTASTCAKARKALLLILRD